MPMIMCGLWMYRNVSPIGTKHNIVGKNTLRLSTIFHWRYVAFSVGYIFMTQTDVSISSFNEG